MNINLNTDSKTLEQCLKSVNQIGGTLYRNICTGQAKYVEWGSADWVGVIFLTTLGIVGIGMVLAMLIDIISN